MALPEDAKLPSAKLMKMKQDKKVIKYKWVPEVLARMLMGRLPSSSELDVEDLKGAGMIALILQMRRLYTDETLIRRLWDPNKKDLTVGPFFLKGLKSPYISDSDPGCVKFIKGAILDEMRKLDPAPPHIRQDLKKLDEYKRKYRNALDGRKPNRKKIMEHFGWDKEKLDKVLEFDSEY